MEAINKAMREAMIMCADSARCIIKYAGTNSRIASEAQVIVDAASHALAAPPRQCDIGTAEEQEARFDKVCMNYSGRDGLCDQKCPMFARHAQGHSCMFEWAQMPYESEVGK